MGELSLRVAPILPIKKSVLDKFQHGFPSLHVSSLSDFLLLSLYDL
jgi:hypothetical protein